tara:strand:- start:545 stop:754 length:210 start_codon:yes stop_codon:yes gene_type:complete
MSQQLFSAEEWKELRDTLDSAYGADVYYLRVIAKALVGIGMQLASSMQYMETGGIQDMLGEIKHEIRTK